MLDYHRDLGTEEIQSTKKEKGGYDVITDMSVRACFLDFQDFGFLPSFLES